ncbi:MAG: hypothetical protein JWR40_4411 [Massilia sp.]|jgi:hypothetical protein|nr:hypothetical protein [Massilia sp.]
MNRPTFRTSIFIAAMLAASAAFAGADIVKCVDQNGKVTLTDAGCGEGIPAVVIPAEAAPTASIDNQVGDTVPAPLPAAVRAVSQRVAYARQPVQHDVAPARRAAKMLSRDVETLRAARLSMQVLDDASANARHQRLAGLN